jgi:hypothetical protein
MSLKTRRHKTNPSYQPVFMADEKEVQSQELRAFGIQTREVKLKLTAQSPREINKLLDTLSLHVKVISSSTIQRDDRDGGVHQFAVVIGGVLDE